MTVVSALAAVAAALFAYMSVPIARRALRISERQLLDVDAPFRIYLTEGFRFRSPKTKESTRILGFSILITNTSSEPNSIVRLELHVECLQDDGRISKYVLPHDGKLTKCIKAPAITPIECPKSFEPRQSESRWALFSETPLIPEDLRRDSYSITVVDARGRVTQTSAILVKDSE